ANSRAIFSAVDQRSPAPPNSVGINRLRRPLSFSKANCSSGLPPARSRSAASRAKISRNRTALAKWGFDVSRSKLMRISRARSALQPDVGKVGGRPVDRRGVIADLAVDDGQVWSRHQIDVGQVGRDDDLEGIEQLTALCRIAFDGGRLQQPVDLRVAVARSV
ncbi:hypothetical protein chiPu_0032451, partial [Chiloscyllium punctatum]|nr:hypothetical protein [Chiloscyllium punctatum]